MSDTGIKRNVVPWFCMAEWEQAYKDLYSQDTLEQTRGYERLLLWKARVPVLPASIECTLGLVQVCLRDREVVPHIHSGETPAYAEHDLRLMYSTSIMRFLNHLSTFAQNVDETLFNMANKLHLPEWLVSLRHDTAHGFNLPSLDLLRTAARIALKWLHEHYWRCGAETTSDWVVGERSSAATLPGGLDSITELMDSWQALKLHILGGYMRVKDLPDLELRTYVQEVTGASPKDDMKLKAAVSLLFNKLLVLIKRRYEKKASLDELISMVVTRESFMPSIKCMELLDDTLDVHLEGDSLPLWLFDLWKEFLTSLQKSHSILPLLVSRLLGLANDESVSLHQQQMAALWVHELCRGLEKGREVLRKVNQFERRKRSTIQDKLFRKQLMKTPAVRVKGKKAPPELKMSRKAAWKMIKNKLERDDPGWKNVLCLELDKAPGSICSSVTLKEVVLKPNSTTRLYLPSLLELMIPPLPQKAKENLVTLVDIYTGHAGETDTQTDPSAPVHTVQELESLDMQSLPMEVVDSPPPSSAAITEHSPPEPEMGWKRCEDDGQWSKCPLGLLPWQQDKVPTFDMPRDISWLPLEPISMHTEEDKSLSGLLGRKIDWSESVRKRPKKKKKTGRLKKLGVKFVRTAFNSVSGPH